MKYGCIGEKLGHSFSAVIHEKIGLYEYELHPVAKKDLHSFLTQRDFVGINVTIPYKKDVIPYCKKISAEAALCGAVNTVVNRDGELYGYNTDFLGMKDLLSFGGIPLAGKKVLILGSGGTAGTAFHLCRHLEAERVEMVSREKKEGCITYEEARARKDVQVIINTTPCGMYPHMGQSALSLEGFDSLLGVADAVYNPLRSDLVLSARERGIPAVGGLYMLVSQAVYAAGIFTGKALKKDLVRSIYDSILRAKENLVLIGMPGCGKSTIGKALAERLGKRFVDCDEEIEKAEGKSIPEIFREVGEQGFRDAESRVIRRASEEQGAVIATGGGAVLREENVRLLRGNGTLLFLDAPLSELMATSSRPLSSTPEDLRRRYEERYGIYCAVCDRKIPVTRSLKENLAAVEKELV